MKLATSLLNKLDADADRKLSALKGVPFAEAQARFRKFVNIQMKLLRLSHKAGAGGLELCHARSALTDTVVRHLLAVLWPAQALPLGKAAFSLVATGGYGRGELSPHSDIDLLFLEGGGVIKEDGSTPLSSLPGTFIQALFDMDLEPGDRAVRTINECIRLAGQNIETMTSLLEARFLAGNEELSTKLQQTLRQKCIKGKEAAYLAARLGDQTARRAKYGNSPCMQEPHIKNSAGGLRDYQNLMWMVFVKFGTRDAAALQQRDLLDASERKELEAAYDYLLRVRNELHYLAGHCADTLTPAFQPGVAAGLGYTGDPRKRTEKFMRDYYTHARNIFLITRTLEQRLALKPDEPARRTLRDFLPFSRHSRPVRQEFDGFVLVDNQLDLADKRGLLQHPERCFRAFRHAQQRGVTLHPSLFQYLRQNVPRFDNRIRSNEHARDTFLEILGARGNVAPTLRAMHEVNLLGKYLPEFDRLTNLVHHEFYHRFAVDEHTLICLQKLDQVWQATQPPFDRYADLFRRLERPHVLYLALLLHDTGKPYDTGRHSEIGSQIALHAARRLRLDGATTHAVCLIIEHHLAMVRTAQKFDIEDPVVVRGFANKVQSLENLDLLTLHTFADSMGTSESLWTGFKDALHWELYHRTREFLNGDTGTAWVEATQLELLRKQVRRLLPATYAEDEVRAHFDGMPSRYFMIHSAEEIVRDVTLAHQFMHFQLTAANQALDPVVQWHDERDRGYAVVHICTWDRAGLFSKITGALAAASLNIYGAQVFTRRDSIIFDEFYVADARTGALPLSQAKERFEQILAKVLTGSLDLEPAIAKTKLLRPLWAGVPGDTLPTVVRLDNEAAEDRTLIEVETEDRVGLLYAISEALVELKLDLMVAKILTEKGAAIDGFYVTEVGGGKVYDPQRQRRIEDRLRKAIEALK